MHRKTFAVFPFTQREFSHHAGIFPVISPSPLSVSGKLPSLLTDGITAYFMPKKAVGVTKNIPLTTEGILRRM
jgi:hypothetical protein